jgi:hypothetical protein
MSSRRAIADETAERAKLAALDTAQALTANTHGPRFAAVARAAHERRTKKGKGHG